MKLKRILSFVLSFAMLISLLPSFAYAEETGIKQPPYKYIISAPAMGFPDIDVQLANGTDTAEKIYVTKDELQYGSIDGSASDEWALALNAMNTFFFREGALWTRVSLSANPEWKDAKNGLVFKIRVPQSGLYAPKIVYDKAANGGIADVYFFDQATADANGINPETAEGIAATVSKLTPKASFDTFNAAANDTKPDMAGNVILPAMKLEAGEYYVLLTLSGENAKLTSASFRYLPLRRIELNDVSLAEMELSHSAETALVGIETEIFARYITKTGELVDFEGDNVTFESGNTNVATVSQDGKIKGVSKGEVTITAKTTIDGIEYTDSIEIYVDELVYENAEINLTENELIITGREKSLSASAYFSDGTIATGSEISVEYSSDDDVVAKIENGVLKAVGEGEANVTATVTFNNETKSVTRKVRVEDKKLSAISADIDAPAVFSYDSTGAKIVVTPMNNDGTEYTVEPEVVIPSNPEYVFNQKALGKSNKPKLADMIANPQNYVLDRNMSTGTWCGAALLGARLHTFYDEGFLYRTKAGSGINLGESGSAFKLTVPQNGKYKPTLTYYKRAIGANTYVYLVDASVMTVEDGADITYVTKNAGKDGSGITLLGTFDTYDASITKDWTGAPVPGEFANYPTIDLKQGDYYLVLSIDAATSNKNIDTSSMIGFYLASFSLAQQIEEKEPEKLEMTCTYESITPDIVSVDENGYVHHVSNGTGRVKVTAEIYGEKYETVFEVVSGTQKTEPTIYTNKMRETALSNAKKYDWAKSLVEKTTKEADKYVENLDFIYDHYPPEGIPRSQHIAMKDTPQEMQWRCPHPECLTDVKNKHGYYAWVVDPLARPWKVQCPECKRLFPSNDFESFYKLGILEDGTFSREKAIEENDKLVASGHPGYLVNITYSDMPDDWMVDAGFGWSETEGYAGYKYTDRICPIAYYTHWLFNMNGVDKRSLFTKAIMTLRDAYLYTGEEKYGVAGAIILDRFADMWPQYDFQKVSIGYLSNHGTGYNGKAVGNNSGKEVMAEVIRGVDAFFPMAGNPKVVSYLSQKAEELGLENKKLTGDMIRENWDNGILRESFENLKGAKIYGHNGGGAQIALAAGIALDCEKETREFIEWAGINEALTVESVTCPIFGISHGARVANAGGNLYSTFYEVIDRDGLGFAVSVSYNQQRYEYAMNNADLMANYGYESDLNIVELPKFVKMFTWLPKFTFGNGYTIANGDGGSYAGTFEVTAPEQFLKAYSYTKAPELAQIYYKWMNGDLSNTYINMFIDPSELVGEIENVIKTYGEYELHSENLAGYGLSTLRGGELIKGAGGRNNIDNRYDTWMYYGATTNSHAHYDALQLGLDAYGFNFTPDLGYPEAATVNPNRTQWIKASISHNLVLVDNDSQNGIDGAEPLHFDDSGTVKLFDAEAADAYDATDIYRRTAVTVAASEKDAYTVDFFRVKGGKSHVYSFHTQSDAGFTSEDFKFIPQVDENGKYVGTLASPEVERGADPAPGMSESKDYETMYPRGYTWLTDVNRADEIKSGIFSVNFKQTDFNKQVEDSKGLNLKYTAVNEWIPTELAIANGLPPQKSNNAAVTGIDYMLITRESEEDMDTLFTSVLQPYKGEEYIASIENADVRIKSGRETADDEVKAIKLNLTNGNTDYVVYATNKNVTYTISDNGKDIFDFSGFVGVYRENEAKQNIYSYVHDGSLCGSASGTASYSGSVLDFTRTPEHKNEIKVKVNGTADASLLVDKQIIINNEKVENAAYTIKSAVADGNVVTLDIGDITLIDGLVDYTDISKGYTYNIAVGEKFTIPLTYTDDARPEFDEVRDNITTSAGSSVSVDVNAESPLGETITYIGTVLPRGASINADTGIVTWKPDASQIGETGFMITARDSSGRESNISFEITVYGATTGNKNETGETPSTENADTPAGNGGGGGGAAPTKPETGKDDESLLLEEKVPSGDEADEVEKSQFTDLGSHAWAADAINALAADGIIKGTTASTFSPGNNITRADFALLLVRAFNLSNNNTENFADVSANDYFAPELAIARNTGIVNGIGDNKFAPRNHITRQDMMVIICRALNSLPLEGKVAPQATDEVLSQYPDFDTVAPYARDAVSALISVGLVNGKNNLIAPTDYTTRAEVAVLIKRILDYTKQTLEKQNKND